MIRQTSKHVPPLSSPREDMSLHSAVHGKTCPSTHLSTGRHVPPLEHINLILSGEAANTNVIVFGLTRTHELGLLYVEKLVMSLH